MKQLERFTVDSLTKGDSVIRIHWFSQGRTRGLGRQSGFRKGSLSFSSDSLVVFFVGIELFLLMHLLTCRVILLERF